MTVGLMLVLYRHMRQIFIANDLINSKHVFLLFEVSVSNSKNKNIAK